MAEKRKDRFGEAQRLYAASMERLVRICLVFLALAFLLYLSGLVPAAVPVHEVPARWGLPLAEYQALAACDPEKGFCPWTRSGGDCLTFAAIFLFNLVPVLCYLRLVPLLSRQGERVLLAFAVLQVLVLLAAAAGLVVPPAAR